MENRDQPPPAGRPAMSNEFDVSFTVDAFGMEALFAEMSKLSGKTVPQLLRERAGLLGRLLASYTQPVANADGGALSAKAGADNAGASGLSPEAKNLGRAAVSGDLARVYVLPAAVNQVIREGKGMNLARQFSGLMRAGKYGEAERFIRNLGIQGAALRVEPWDDGARHRRVRNRHGRVSKGAKPVITTNVTAAKAYRKKKLDMVGFSKSSWITAAQQINGAKGLSRIPAWIRKHNAPGRGIDRTQGQTTNPHVILESTLKWMQDAFSARTTNAIFQIFGDLIVKDLEHAIEALKAKAASGNPAVAGATA